MSPLIEAGRGALEEEFQLAQRLDTKIQYQIAVTAGWFAVTQTFAAAVLNRAEAPRFWIIVVIVLGVLAVLTLYHALRATFEVWRLRPDKGVSSEHLRNWTNRAHQHDDPQVAGELAKEYAVLLDQRRANNDTRAGALQTSFWWCGVAASVIGIEFIAALGVRLLTAL